MQSIWPIRICISCILAVTSDGTTIFRSQMPFIFPPSLPERPNVLQLIFLAASKAFNIPWLLPLVEMPSMRVLKGESTSIRPRSKGECLEDTCRSRSECPGVRQCANALLARDSLRNMPMLIRSVYSRLDTIRARSFWPAPPISWRKSRPSRGSSDAPAAIDDQGLPRGKSRFFGSQVESCRSNLLWLA